MAKTGAADSRPMVVLYFSDCDPSGWQMPISVSRKLQAFREGLFTELDYRVYRVGLTPDQVREYGLPSTPLKDTEKRADRWQQSMGVEQTEIDALASLRPDLLRQIARGAIAPFYDLTLRQRVAEAKSDWERAANEIVEAHLDDGERERIRAEASVKLDELAGEINELKQRLRVDPGAFELPPIVIPEAETEGVASDPPLIDSRWPFAAQCRALIDSKAYRNGDSA
jgi:hypothetical protein